MNPKQQTEVIPASTPLTADKMLGVRLNVTYEQTGEQIRARYEVDGINKKGEVIGRNREAARANLLSLFRSQHLLG